ncbi:hypothetical protein [Burkholderia sp. BCC1988]|uniref:hypothetical protein n=1 Tax=Burkholderia sp. BCC1988 TaxID=2817443 RepID=UPI002AAF6216|nr:hypothetical protein [Burkholderia sp. BCC1988]
MNIGLVAYVAGRSEQLITQQPANRAVCNVDSGHTDHQREQNSDIREIVEAGVRARPNLANLKTPTGKVSPTNRG